MAYVFKMKINSASLRADSRAFLFNPLGNQFPNWRRRGALGCRACSAKSVTSSSLSRHKLDMLKSAVRFGGPDSMKSLQSKVWFSVFFKGVK